MPVAPLDGLLDLAQVTVLPALGVDGEVALHFAEKQILAQGAAGAGDAALRIHDDVVRFHQSLLDQRKERQHDGGGVATGVRDQAGVPKVRSEHLGQAEDRMGQEIGGGVIVFVPAFVALLGP